MLKFKGWVQGCVFSCYYLLRQRVLLCRKVLEVQLYEFWLKSGLIKYQQGHLERIFLANFCKIFFRFEGSLLANCTRQSVEEDHYGNWYTKCIVSTILFLLPSRVNTSFHTLPVTPGGWEVGGGKGGVSSLRSHFSFSQGRLGSGKEVKTPGKFSVRVVASKASPPSPPPDNPGDIDLIIGATLTDCELTQAIVKSEERGLRWVWRSNLRFNTNNLILNRAVIYGPSEGLSNSLFFTYLYSYPPQLCRELF